MASRVNLSKQFISQFDLLDRSDQRARTFWRCTIYMNPVWLVGCIPLLSLHAIDMHAFNFTFFNQTIFSINTQHVSLINPILLDLSDVISIEPYDFQ